MNPTTLPTQTSAPWTVDTDLTVYTVVDLRNQLLERFTLADDVTLDLEHVQACDCAGLLLLCAARKTSETLGKPLQILRCSAAVTAAADSIGLNLSELLDPRHSPHS